MRKKIDMEKIQKLSMFQQEYGPKGTDRREEFEAKARARYYAEVLRDARKAAGMTQQQLAEKIGKKRAKDFSAKFYIYSYLCMNMSESFPERPACITRNEYGRAEQLY